MRSHLKSAAWACLLVGAVMPLRAKLACPVMLTGGQVHEGNVSVSFRNQGKAPIRELSFACAARQGSRANCYTETGVFFPATPYEINFSYPGKAPGSMVLSLKAAFFADGLQWTSLRDQPCKTLRIARR
jgi:hypothetical protein